MNKKSLFALTVGLLVAGSLITAKNISADQEDNPTTSLVAKISQKFNLNQNDVQSVFSEYHQERQSQRVSQLETRLTQAVSDGKISDSQKQAILAKIQENQADREPGHMRDLSSEQRQSEMENRRNEMDTWLQSIGLDIDTFHELVGMGQGNGRGGNGRGRHMMGK